MPKKNYTIGIDIGGTNMKAVLWNGEKIIMDYSLATPRDTLDHIIVMINAIIEPLLEKATSLKEKVAGIGVSVAGPYDYKKELVGDCPNTSLLSGVNLKKIIEEKLNLPVKIENDTNCFLRAEMIIGATKKYKNVFGLIVSTGIGGGWWNNGKIYLGTNGGASEPGATIINFTNMISVEEAYQKLNQNNALNLATEAYHGDELAKKSFEEIGKLLGATCANIVNLMDPEAIVIGGGTTKASDLFFPQIKKTMPPCVLNPSSRKTKIIKGKIGDNAGAIGAALLF